MNPSSTRPPKSVPDAKTPAVVDDPVDTAPPVELLAPLPAPRVWVAFQRGASLVALVALAPLFVGLWALVKATSSGPFLTRRQRIGFLGVPFGLLKIRTTHLPGPYATVRQTIVGTALRRLKLDELPQLWHVVAGDMLWVGPRPLPASTSDRLSAQLPDFTERQRVMPGLTNLGSISTLYDESSASAEPNLHSIVESDLHYIRNRSVSYDLTSIALTGCYLVRSFFSSLFHMREGSRRSGKRAKAQMSQDVGQWLASDELDLRPRESSLLWRFGQKTLAALGLVAASPLFAFMYVGVKLTSPGPFFFCQQRRGFLGHKFTIYKVRTLSVGSEKKTALGVQMNDPTVTRFGKLLRNLKFDELPQLYNVLRGDMELVGPRPIPLALEDRLLESIPDFGLRHLVRPGLTNVGQVSVNDNELDDRLIEDWTLRAESERHYVANKTLSYDVVMVVLTSLFIARKFLKRSSSKTTDQQADLAESGPTATVVLGSPIANLDYQGVIELMGRWIEAGDPHRFVNICPVHSLVESKMNPSHRESIQGADLNTADGMPVVWAKKLLGDRNSSRVYGPTLMLKALEVAAQEGWRVGLFGGHPERLALLENKLVEKYPDLNVAFRESPPFRPPTEEESASLVSRMNDAELDLVWVGLGCPKQERWMLDHSQRIRGVFVGVGAAFDFHTGMLRQAPRWMQVAGLEWFFRLCCEPRRLMRRYATTNPVFIALFSLQVLGKVVLRRSYRRPLESAAPPKVAPTVESIEETGEQEAPSRAA